MDRQIVGVSVAPEAFVAAMRSETEKLLREVMGAVNQAPDGAWINDSESTVRDLFGDYRRCAYQKAVQMKVDATEGAFFPGGPSTGRRVGKQGA